MIELHRSHLANVLPLWPAEAADGTVAGRRHVLVLIERAMQMELHRLWSGHWAASPGQLGALQTAYVIEKRALEDAAHKTG